MLAHQVKLTFSILYCLIKICIRNINELLLNLTNPRINYHQTEQSNSIRGDFQTSRQIRSEKNEWNNKKSNSNES